jgi:hypothetical protein
VAIWKSLRILADSLVEYRLPSYLGVADNWTKGNLRAVFRDTALVPILVVPGVWSIPLFSRLLALGSLSAPLSIVFMISLIAGLVVVTFRIHRMLNLMFSQTFLGDDDPFSADDSKPEYGEEETYVYSDKDC